ncbi:MAG TPA: serpin family protein [Opitutaceae bacterium]|nr:serpin family protein [Opitutaceae bacterium]
MSPKPAVCLLHLTLVAIPLLAQTDPVTPAINQFGLELLRAQGSAADRGNLLLSPYSIEAALAMAYTGADGRTREEMRRVLHLPVNDAAVFDGFADLAGELDNLQAASRRRAQIARGAGATEEPIEINVANRLFAQSGFAFRPAFTNALREKFAAPLEELDFFHAAEPARVTINAWVARETRGRIRALVPAGAIDATTRAVLANALYLRAAWANAFDPDNTKNERFWIDGKKRTEVPTMLQERHYGYEKRNGYIALALPYVGAELQFVILLPDQRDGLADLEQTVTPDLLAGCAKLSLHDVILHLPKFKLEPPSLPLGALLRELGMTTAFNQPPGSADFDRMAPRKPDDYLCISEVFHQTWLSLDEKGTEAAAATATVMRYGLAVAREPSPPPIEVRVDRPFLFAIQHVSSGTCLFLGHLTGPP